MKILYLLPGVTHPTMRGELRHYHFLGRLAKKHDVSVLALTRTQVTTEALDDLGALAARVVVLDASAPAGDRDGRASAGVLAWRRRLAKRRRVKHTMRMMRTRLREILASERFDVAVVYSTELEPVVGELRGLPIVADVCDAQSMRIRQSLRYSNPIERAWRLVSWWRTRMAERRIARLAHSVICISERDRAALPSAAGGTSVISNGLDADYWSRSSPPSPASEIVFTGVLDYGPNADAARHLVAEILPRVRAALPDVRLTIAGRNPTEQLRGAAAGAGGVDITGYVDDLRTYLERAAVFAAPLRFASGTQNKILEAMAMELPVVTSSVAADGLRVNGAGAPPVLVADRPDAFAEAVIDLLGDRNRRQHLGAAGRSYVLEHFDWDRSARELENQCRAAALGCVRQEGADARRLAVHE